MSKRPELLAPVGQIESFYAAIENGANAVYVGGKQFSARQFAQNLDMEQLKEIVDYAHLRNIKVYITVNTLIKNHEMNQAALYIHELSMIGVDAIIIQDFGLARLVKNCFPNMALHASTQMSAHSKYDVLFLKKAGYKRVVLARELSLKEISSIRDFVSIEIESFVHGALCVSYSGQCLMSSIIGGRSGNRGRCAQPCRLPYTLTKDGVAITDHEGPYLMSPKDIETLDLIPDLIGSGINTFKIEGRMKAPEYIASVARIYNKYIDLALKEGPYEVDENDKDELLTVFNRGGFTKGYYSEKPGHAMMATHSPKNIGLLIGQVTGYHGAGHVQIKTNKKLNPGDGIGILTRNQTNVGAGISKEIMAGEVFTLMIKGRVSIGDPVYLSKDHQLSNELAKSYIKNNRKSSIKLELRVKLDQPIKLDLIHESGARVSLEGNLVPSAEKAPIRSEKLRAQVSKFGNTPFEPVEVSLDKDENVFVSISSLNELRRAGSDALIKEILKSNQYDGKGYERYLESTNKKESLEKNKTFTASVRTMDQLEACLGRVSHIYWELECQSIFEIQEAVEMCHRENTKLSIALPHIQREKDDGLYESIMSEIEKSQIDGYLLRTYGQYEKLMTSTKEKVIDFTLNVVNNESIAYWESYKVDKVTLSVELSDDELQEMRGKCLEMVIYGHIPIMTTEQCLIGRYGQCPKANEKLKGIYKLTDRKEEEYPLITNCKMCRMQILSSKPIVLADRMNLIQKLPIHTMRLIFTSEEPRQVKELLAIYQDQTSQYQGDYTNRYFIKGVE